MPSSLRRRTAPNPSLPLRAPPNSFTLTLSSSASRSSRSRAARRPSHARGAPSTPRPRPRRSAITRGLVLAGAALSGALQALVAHQPIDASGHRARGATCSAPAQLPLFRQIIPGQGHLPRTHLSLGRSALRPRHSASQKPQLREVGRRALHPRPLGHGQRGVGRVLGEHQGRHSRPLRVSPSSSTRCSTGLAEPDSRDQDHLPLPPLHHRRTRDLGQQRRRQLSARLPQAPCAARRGAPPASYLGRRPRCGCHVWQHCPASVHAQLYGTHVHLVHYRNGTQDWRLRAEGDARQRHGAAQAGARAPSLGRGGGGKGPMSGNFASEMSKRRSPPVSPGGAGKPSSPSTWSARYDFGASLRDPKSGSRKTEAGRAAALDYFSARPSAVVASSPVRSSFVVSAATPSPDGSTPRSAAELVPKFGRLGMLSPGLGEVVIEHAAVNSSNTSSPTGSLLQVPQVVPLHRPAPLRRRAPLQLVPTQQERPSSQHVWHLG